MNNTIKYTKEQYDRHVQKIEELEKQYADVKQALSTADRRLVDGWLRSSEVRDLSQQATHILRELTALRNKTIEIIDETEESSVVTIGHTYRLSVKYPNGEQRERAIKLVQQDPDMSNLKNITELSIKSPLGASIYGKEIGSVSEYKVAGQPGIGVVHILEEIKTATNLPEEME